MAGPVRVVGCAQRRRTAPRNSWCPGALGTGPPPSINEQKARTVQCTDGSARRVAVPSGGRSAAPADEPGTLGNVN